MKIEQQCYIIFRADMFGKKLMQSRFRLFQAFGAMVVNFAMSFSYATILQIGYKEWIRRSKTK